MSGKIIRKNDWLNTSYSEVAEVSNSPLLKIAFYMMPVLLILLLVFADTDQLNFFILIGSAAAYITFILSIKPLRIEVINT